MFDVCCLCKFVSLSLGFEGNKRYEIWVWVGSKAAGTEKKAEKKPFSFGDLQVCKTWTMKKIDAMAFLKNYYPICIIIMKNASQSSTNTSKV